MKKIFFILSVLAAVAAMGACDLLGLGEETWSYTAGVGEMTSCVEVTTNNADLKRALEQSGIYVQEACALNAGSGACTIDSMAGFTEYTVDWTYVYGSYYDAAAVQTMCDALGGVYSQN